MTSHTPTRSHAAPTRRSVRALAILVVACVLIVSCRWQRAEILVHVATDLDQGGGHALAFVRLTVRTRDSNGPVAYRSDITLDADHQLPFSFEVHPLGDDAARTAWIEVAGCGAGGCDHDVVVTQRAQVDFVARRLRHLAIGLGRSCAFVACDAPSQTCENASGVCVDATVPASAYAATDALAQPLLARVTQLAAGGGSTCSSQRADAVRCWGGGSDYLGYLGPHGSPGAASERATPTAVSGTADVTGLAVGNGHACALSRDAHVLCWGNGERGQTGTDLENHAIPTTVSSIDDAVEVATGDGISCARTRDGHVSCWGRPLGSDPSRSPVDDSSVPTVVAGLDATIQIGVGDRHACALRDDGTVRCWGANDQGQLGDSLGTRRATVSAAVPIDGVVEIATGGFGSCARRRDGSVWCWGENLWGERGDGTTDRPDAPTQAVGIDHAVQLSVGRFHR